MKAHPLDSCQKVVEPWERVAGGIVEQEGKDRRGLWRGIRWGVLIVGAFYLAVWWVFFR